MGGVPMRPLYRFLALLALFCPAAHAQTKLEATDLATHPFSADFPSGGQIRMHIRSGEIRILGSEDDKITVELSGKNAADAKDLKVRLERSADQTNLRVSAGPTNALTIPIYAPQHSGLCQRTPSGR